MPKERINTSDRDSPMHIEVVWQPDCDMGIGIVTEMDSLLQQLYGGAQTELIGQKMRELVHAFGEGVEDLATLEQRVAVDRELAANLMAYMDNMYGRIDSVWVSVDRPNCNRLIAKLRRARNQVFGADE